MKKVEEIKREIENKHMSFGRLNQYMVSSGYHSNLEDTDPLRIRNASKIIFLGKEEYGKVEMNVLITRQSAFADGLCMVITDVHELND